MFYQAKANYQASTMECFAKKNLHGPIPQKATSQIYDRIVNRPLHKYDKTFLACCPNDLTLKAK